MENNKQEPEFDIRDLPLFYRVCHEAGLIALSIPIALLVIRIINKAMGWS